MSNMLPEVNIEPPWVSRRPFVQVNVGVA